METQFAITRARLVIVKEGKVLLVNNLRDDFHYLIGGKVHSGEKLIDTCKREVKEECGEDVEFTFKKILYIKDFISQNHTNHSLEIYILGDINKFEELEGKSDPEHDGQDYMTWVDLEKLPTNFKPSTIAKRIFEDYKNGFEVSGEYIEEE